MSSCFGGSLVQCNVEPDVAVKAQYNKLRRFLPTLGNVLGVSSEDCQAIGSWVEMPSGASTSSAKKREPMSLRYAGAKLVCSAVVKQAIMTHFLKVMRSIRSRNPELLDDMQLWRPGSLTWGQFTSHLREVPFPGVSKPWEVISDDEAVPSFEQRVIQDAATKPTLRPSKKAKTSDPGPTLMPDSDSSESCDSGASQLSAAQTVLPEEGLVQVPTIPWFRQGKSTHVVSFLDEDGRHVPYCRSTPFHQDPADSGDILTEKEDRALCARCRKKLPPAMVAALAELYE